MHRFVRGAMVKLIEGQLNDLSNYVETLESARKQEEKHLEDLLSRVTAGMDQEEASMVVGDWYADDIGWVQEAVPRLLWYGAFVSVICYFEYEMLQLSRRDLREQKGKFPSGLKKEHKQLRYTDDAVAYWKARGISFPESGKAWQEIGELRKVRNQIVHEGGLLDVKSRSKSIKAYVALRRRGRKKSVSIKADGFSGESLVLSADFCREAVETIKKFFEDLVKVLP